MAEMDQDDIDALLNSVGNDSDNTEPAPPAEDTGGTVDQSEIDALFESNAAAEGSEPDSGMDSDTDSGGGSLDQDNIDALFESGGDETSDTDVSLTEGGDSDDMDALLAEIQSDPSAGQGGDDVDINDLLTEIQSESPQAGTMATQDDIDALMSSVGGSMEEVPEPLEEEGVNVDFLLDMKLTITFEVGRSKMLIGDLLSLGQGSVIELHRLVGEDLDMFVNGRLIAKGEVVVVNEKFGVRILDIVPPEERIKQMAGMDKLV